MLVLCGSSVSTIESETLGHESALYGRRTGQVDLQPFSFQQAREAIADDFEVTLFNYAQSLAENINTHLSPTAVLYNEPEFLLRTEQPENSP